MSLGYSRSVDSDMMHFVLECIPRRLLWNFLVSRSSLLLRNVLAEELLDQRGHFIAVRFQPKVPGIDQVKFQRLEIAFVRLGARRRKDLVVLSPYDQHRRL